MTTETDRRIAHVHSAAASIIGGLVEAHFRELDTETATEPGLDGYTVGLIDAHKELRQLTSGGGSFEEMRDEYREHLREKVSGSPWARGFNEASEKFLERIVAMARAERRERNDAAQRRAEGLNRLSGSLARATFGK